MSSQSSSSSEPLSPHLLGALRAQLAQGERLTWAACAEPAAFEPKARGTKKWEAVTILGGGYATLGAGLMAVRSGLWLWLSVPISLLALGVLGYFVSSWIKARARRAIAGTVYALTTQRALIIQTYPALTVRALAIAAIADVSVTNKHARSDLGDLDLASASATQAFVFRGVAEPERARKQMLRVIRDPRAVEEELAAAAAYSLAMQRLMPRPSPR